MLALKPLKSLAPVVAARIWLVLTSPQSLSLRVEPKLS